MWCHVSVIPVLLVGVKGPVCGVMSVLVKYVAMVQEHASQVLPIAARVCSVIPSHYHATTQVLSGGVCGSLLPELAVGLVLLQLKTPSVVLESDCVPLLRGLVELLDRFNRLAPNVLADDEEDLAWTGVKSNQYMYMYACNLSCYRIVCGRGQRSDDHNTGRDR